MKLFEVNINAFQNGENVAFEVVFNHFYPLLTYFATQLVKDEEQGKDIAIEAIETAWFHRANITSPGALKRFLYTSTKNKCYNLHRSIKVHNRIHEDIKYLSRDSYENYALNYMIKTELMMKLFQTAKGLSDVQKEVLRLSFGEGKKIPEIASILNQSAIWVKNTRRRTLDYLRKKLE